MKIKVKEVDFDAVNDKTFPKRKKPLKPNIFLARADKDTFGIRAHAVGF